MNVTVTLPFPGQALFKPDTGQGYLIAAADADDQIARLKDAGYEVTDNRAPAEVAQPPSPPAGG